MASSGGTCRQSPEQVLNALLLSALAGRRAMAVIAADEADASALAARVAAHMEAAGALVLTVTGAPGLTLEELLGQEAGRAVLAGTLAQNLDMAGLIAVSRAHELDPSVLAQLLRLCGAEPGTGLCVQMILTGNTVLADRLDGPDLAAIVQRLKMLRWFVPSAKDPDPAGRPLASKSPLQVGHRTSRRSWAWLSLAGLLVASSVAATAGAFRLSNLIRLPGQNAEVTEPAEEPPGGERDARVEDPKPVPAPSLSESAEPKKQTAQAVRKATLSGAPVRRKAKAKPPTQ